MRTISIALTAAALGAALVSEAVSGQAASPPAAADALPPGPAHDTMVRVCSGCHAPEIAAQQRLSKAGWHDLVEQMAGRGAQGSDDDFVQITDYLAKNFPDQPAAK